MARTPRTESQRSSGRRTIRVGGRAYAVIGQIDVRRRRYLLLDRLSASLRERYLAYDPYAGPRGQPVAILILPPSRAARQHLEVLQKLSESSDAFPTLLDYDPQDKRSVVVLKWIDGPTLEEYLHAMQEGAKPRISASVAFQRVRWLAHGLRRRHAGQQIVHGDIKPANLIVTRDPGRFVLIDFGSAWDIANTVGRAEGDGISPLYAAPELQTAEAYVNFRCDQFSLSVVLYQLLTFQIPYNHLGGKAGRPESMAGEAPRLRPPSELSPDRQRLPTVVWQGIDRVVMRGLALDPNDRYPTPEAWLDDLDKVQLDFQRPPTLSPLNDRLTRVVSWLANRLGRW